MRIHQCHVSDGIKLFREGFKKKWGLVDYYNQDLPSVFLGIYTDEDIVRIRNHRGIKIIVFAGRDISKAPLFEHEKNLYIFCNELLFKDKLGEYIKKKVVKFYPNALALKDYSIFKPTPLGTKIYCYQRKRKESSRQQLNYALIERLMKRFGEEMFLIGYLGHSIETMIEKYYKPSFINIQLDLIAGHTSALEMAHMGRRNISNYPNPFCIPYQTEDDIIKTIESERTRIGRIQNEVSKQAQQALFESEDWLDTDYWI